MTCLRPFYSLQFYLQDARNLIKGMRGNESADRFTQDSCNLNTLERNPTYPRFSLVMFLFVYIFFKSGYSEEIYYFADAIDIYFIFKIKSGIRKLETNKLILCMDFGFQP